MKRTRKGMRGRELAAFYGNLSRLLEAGLPPADALGLLSRETPDARYAEVCDELARHAEEGEPLSVALSVAAPSVPPSHCTLLYVGESSGDLRGVLSRLSTFLERDKRALSRAVSAGLYPGGVLILLFGLSLVFALSILPGLARVAAALDPEVGEQIRGHARLMLVSSLAVFVSAGFATFVLFFGWSHGSHAYTSFGRRLDYALMRVPVLGRLLASRRLAQLFFAVELQLAHGATAEEALPVAGETVEGSAWRFECARMETRLREGERLCEIMSDSPLIPRVAALRLCITEAGGSLAEICGELYGYFDREFDRRLETASAAIEPALIALAGAVFALFVATGVLPLLHSYVELVS